MKFKLSLFVFVLIGMFMNTVTHAKDVKARDPVPKNYVQSEIQKATTLNVVEIVYEFEQIPTILNVNAAQVSSRSCCECNYILEISKTPDKEIVRHFFEYSKRYSCSCV